MWRKPARCATGCKGASLMNWKPIAAFLPWLVLILGVASLLLNWILYNKDVARTGKQPFSMLAMVIMHVLCILIGFLVALFLPEVAMGFVAGGGAIWMLIMFFAYMIASIREK